MEDRDCRNLSLGAKCDYLKDLEEKVKKIESNFDKIKEESFNEIIKSAKLDNTLDALNKATVELRAENKELREEIKNMNNTLRTTLSDTLNKMVEFSNQQSSDTMKDSFKDKEFLKKLLLVFASALVTIVLGVLGIKTLIPL